MTEPQDTVPSAEPNNDPVAVIDIGSGAVKLLIIDRAGLAVAPREAASNRASDQSSPATLLSFGIKTRLIAGATGRMSDESLAATAAAFATFRGHIDELAPGAVASGRVRAVATAVARDTSNLGALEEITSRELGVDLEVLSGEREAELAFLGATYGRPWNDDTVVMDIGAGSTEFAYGEPGWRPRLFGALSLPVGGRVLIDSYLASDPPRPEELSSALSVVELHIDDLVRELPDINGALESTVIVAGAMTQIAAVEIGLADPDAPVDGEIIRRDGIEDLFRTLATESTAERIHNPGMKPEHAADILGALCVLVEFMRQCSVDQVVVSERSVRHGLAVEMLEER
jgi:exopolyphosphatase/guanosine-5'-triphosphate,3'-diphosphate pyrophosphatase